MKKNVAAILIFIGLIILGAAVFIIFFSSSDSRLVNLALQKEGKTYVFSKSGPQITQSAIEKEKSPYVFPFMELLVRKELYISPYKMEELCNLLGGGYTLHEYAEKSYEGYVTTRSQEHYILTTENQSTEQVGEQLLINTVTLTNDQGATKRIVWSQKPQSSKQTPIENCELKSFMIVTSPHPGETVGNFEKILVVKLKDLVDFFNSGLSLEYKKKEQLLYVKE